MTHASATPPANANEPTTDSRALQNRPAHASPTLASAPDLRSTQNTTESPSQKIPPDGRPPSTEVETPAPPPATPALPHRLRLRISPWQTRLLRDAILPTHPTRAGEDDAVDALRERLFLARQLQAPLTLKNPVAQTGFALDLPADAGSSPRWLDATGATPAGAAISGRRAEFTAPAPGAPAIDCALRAADGRLLARVTGDAVSGFHLYAGPDLRAWPWLALTRAAADDTVLSPAEWTSRLEWRVLEGAPATSSWQRDDRFQNARAHRLDLVADGTPAPDRATRTLALVDRLTGWAAVTLVEATDASPAPARP